MGNTLSTPPPPLPHDFIFNNTPVRMVINKHISHQDCVALAHQLASNDCVCTDLFFNATRFFTHIDSLAYLLGPQGLQRNKTVTTLDLSSTGINDNSILYISRFLRNNNTLQVLVLNDNLITNYGADLLLRSLERNTSLVTLSCHYNRITDTKLCKLITNIHLRPAIEFQTKDVDHTITIPTLPSVGSNLSQRGAINYDPSSKSLTNDSPSTTTGPTIIISAPSPSHASNPSHIPSETISPQVRDRRRSRAGSRSLISDLPVAGTFTSSPLVVASSRAPQQFSSPSIQQQPHHNNPLTTPAVSPSSQRLAKNEHKTPHNTPFSGKDDSIAGGYLDRNQGSSDDDDENWQSRHDDADYIDDDDVDEDTITAMGIQEFIIDRSLGVSQPHPELRPNDGAFNLDLLSCIQMDFEYFGSAQISADLDIDQGIRTLSENHCTSNYDDGHILRLPKKKQQKMPKNQPKTFDSDDAEIIPSAINNPASNKGKKSPTIEKSAPAKGNKVRKQPKNAKDVTTPTTITITTNESSPHAHNHNNNNNTINDAHNTLPVFDTQAMLNQDNNGSLTALIHLCLAENAQNTSDKQKTSNIQNDDYSNLLATTTDPLRTIGAVSKRFRKRQATMDRYAQVLNYFFTFPQLCLLLPRLIASLFESEHPNYTPENGTWFNTPSLITKIFVLTNHYQSMSDFELFQLAVECCTIPCTIIEGNNTYGESIGNKEYCNAQRQLQSQYRVLKTGANNSIKPQQIDELLKYTIWDTSTRSYELYKWFVKHGYDVLSLNVHQRDALFAFYTPPTHLFSALYKQPETVVLDLNAIPDINTNTPSQPPTSTPTLAKRGVASPRSHVLQNNYLDDSKKPTVDFFSLPTKDDDHIAPIAAPISGICINLSIPKQDDDHDDCIIQTITPTQPQNVATSSSFARSPSLLSPRSMSFKTLKKSDLTRIFSSTAYSPFSPQQVTHQSASVPQQPTTTNNVKSSPFVKNQNQFFNAPNTASTVHNTPQPTAPPCTPLSTPFLSPTASLTRKQSHALRAIVNFPNLTPLTVEEWITLARQQTIIIPPPVTTGALQKPIIETDPVKLKPHPRISTLLLHVHTVFPNPNTPTGRYPFIDGLPKNPSYAQIKNVYRQISLVCHPDKLQTKHRSLKELGNRVFATITEAFQRYCIRHDKVKQKKGGGEVDRTDEVILTPQPTKQNNNSSRAEIDIVDNMD